MCHVVPRLPQPGHRDARAKLASLHRGHHEGPPPPPECSASLTPRYELEQRLGCGASFAKRAAILQKPTDTSQELGHSSASTHTNREPFRNAHSKPHPSATAVLTQHHTQTRDRLGILLPVTTIPKTSHIKSKPAHRKESRYRLQCNSCLYPVPCSSAP